MSVFFISNNPRMACLTDSGIFLEADALEVLTHARNAIHVGWCLTHHPLYGNFRPNRQPYRSIILAAPNPDETDEVDLRSLHLIEEALLVYTNCAPISPEETPASIRDACSLLDFEIMRLPLEQAGVMQERPQAATYSDPWLKTGNMIGGNDEIRTA